MNDKILQDLEDFQPEEESKQFPRLRRIFLVVAGIIALGLMLSYVFVTFPIADIIQGRMQSTTILDNKLTINNILIILDDSVREELQQAFLKQQKTEFSACLTGKVKKAGGAGGGSAGGNGVDNVSVGGSGVSDVGGVEVEVGRKEYHITSFYFPKMYRQLFNQVVFESCSPETLILLHTHPYKRCSASSTDLNTLRTAQQANPDVLMMVLCEKERVAVYGELR